MQCRPTLGHCGHSGTTSLTYGDARLGGAVSGTDSLGHGLQSWLMTGSLNRESFIPGQAYALPSNTQGGSRMREFRSYGSMRGTASNGRLYREQSMVVPGVRFE